MTSTFNQLFAIDDTYLYSIRTSSIAGVTVNGIGRWDGGVNTVEAVGGGLDNGFALAVITGSATDSIYVAGTFTSIGGGTSVNRIAYYNGSSWSNLGGAPVFTTTVNQLAYDSDNNLLYAGSAGSSTNANRVSVYNGSTWTGIVTGFTINTSNYIKFALDSDNNLYVGHGFALRRWNRVDENWTEISTFVGGTIRSLEFDTNTNRVYIVLGTSSANNIRYYNIDGNSLDIHSTYPGSPYALKIDTNGDIFIAGSGSGSFVDDVAKYNGSGYTGIFNFRDTAACLDMLIDAGGVIHTYPNSSGRAIGTPPYSSSGDWDEWDSSATTTISGPVGGSSGDAGGDPYVTPVIGPSILLPRDWETVNLYTDKSSKYQLLGTCGFLSDKQMERLHTMDFFYHTERAVTRLDEHIWHSPYFKKFEVYYQGRKQLTIDGISGEVKLSQEGRQDRPSGRDLSSWDLIKVCHLGTPKERGLHSVTQNRHFPKRKYRAYCLRLGEDKVVLSIDSYWDDINHIKLLLGKRKRHCPSPNKSGELIRHSESNCLSRLDLEKVVIE